MGSSLDQGHCIVLLGNTLNSHSTSLRPTVQMDNDKFNDGGKPAMDHHPTQGGVEILLVTSYPMGHVGRMEM